MQQTKCFLTLVPSKEKMISRPKWQIDVTSHSFPEAQREKKRTEIMTKYLTCACRHLCNRLLVGLNLTVLSTMGKKAFCLVYVFHLLHTLGATPCGLISTIFLALPFMAIKISSYYSVQLKRPLLIEHRKINDWVENSSQVTFIFHV